MYSYREYPQFKYSTNRNYSVTATLDQTPEGYWTAADSALIITNLSEKYRMRLISVSVDGIDAAFDVKTPVYLKPGESCTLPLRGSIPETSLTTADITVNYSLIGSITPLGSRTLVFTLTNGAPPAYDPAAPYTGALHETAFERSVPAGVDTALAHIGVFDFLKMLFNSLCAVLRTLTGR